MSRVPVKIKDISELKINYFPLVGFLLAVIIIISEYFLSYLFAVEIRALLLLIIYVYLTGALHLDGLGDFADGFFAGRDKEKTIKIMHDSNSGIFALVTLILVLALKYLLFKELLFDRNIQAIIIMAVLIRYILGYVVIFIEPAESSILGSALSDSAELIDLFYSTFITIIIFYAYIFFTESFFLYQILLSVVIISLLVLYLASWSHKKLGGITGDIHGTIIELGELIFLLTLSIF